MLGPRRLSLLRVLVLGLGAEREPCHSSARGHDTHELRTSGGERHGETVSVINICEPL